jgi:hypothetical protein
MTSIVLSLTDARAALGIPATETAKNADITFYIGAVVPIIEDIVGPVDSRSCDEWHDGGGSIVLDEAPVRTVASVTETSGGVTRTLTEQPLDGETGNPYGYTLDEATGRLDRRSAGSWIPFAEGRRNVHVTYTAGRQACPPNVTLAARRLLRHLWQQEQNGGRPAMSGAEPTVTTPSGYAVPRVVVELCGSEARPWGMS